MYQLLAGDPEAVAASSADGGLVAMGLLHGAIEQAVAVYPATGGAELYSDTVDDNTDEEVWPHTLAFVPTGTALFAVTGGGGLPDVFRVFPLPLSISIITTVSPSTGPVTGGTTVTITGTGLTGTTAVLFGGIPASSLDVMSDGQIQVVSPGGSSGMVTETVSAPGGSSASTDNDEFTYTPVPGITSPADATAVVKSPFSFTISTSGAPTPSLEEKGHLLKGVRFHSNGNGTGTLSGTPTKVGVHIVTIMAIFGTGKTRNVIDQAFTLAVVK